MKAKSVPLIALGVAIVCLGIWWFTRQTAASPEKIAEVPMPTKPSAPKQIAPPTIAPPLQKPAQPVAASQPAASPNPSTNADPQAELKTAIQDIVCLYRTGDLVALYQTYTPPDKLDSQVIQNLRVWQAGVSQQDSGQQRAQQIMLGADAQAYEALVYQTPTLNATGKEATYMITRATISDLDNNATTFTGIPAPLVFIEIDGKWYLKPGGSQ